MGKKTLKIIAAALCLCLCRASCAWSELLFIDDGRILFGAIVGASAGKVIYKVDGAELSLKAESILRSETDISAIADMDVEVRLRDASVIEGRISSCDENGDLAIETSFGPQSLPSSIIAAIIDPKAVPGHSGGAMILRAGGGAYAPLFSGSSLFGPSWTTTAGASWALGFAPGLYAGFDVSYAGADYLAGGLGYSFASLRPELSYRLAPSRGKSSLLGRLTPLLSVSGGPAYVALSGATTTPSSYGNLTAEFGLSAGLEIAIAAGVAARLEGRADAYVQADAPFVTLGGNLSIAYQR
jgi:hypothetical protein